ncbi:class I lanthipeptide [Hymenobacter persicinus]|uniref:RSAM-modified peptide n=1 Tax=Hymenobacter persicinus TaxID=2025506 RepID=A0A4Q5LGH4_9BACT|nr:class I lanthipeptide [Hymenobacter persicinus]RYU82494.1 rSAM-modified peptide [Hymenobacter persicinus]
MKKITTKLTLNKHTLATLDQQQMAAAKGGFFYTLSWDDVCKVSQNHTAGNRADCLAMFE